MGTRGFEERYDPGHTLGQRWAFWMPGVVPLGGRISEARVQDDPHGHTL